MAHETNQSISLPVNDEQDAPSSTPETQPVQTRAGLKLRTNIKAGMQNIIFRRLDEDVPEEP